MSVTNVRNNRSVSKVVSDYANDDSVFGSALRFMCIMFVFVVINWLLGL